MTFSLFYVFLIAASLSNCIIASPTPDRSVDSSSFGQDTTGPKTATTQAYSKLGQAGSTSSLSQDTTYQPKVATSQAYPKTEKTGSASDSSQDTTYQQKLATTQANPKNGQTGNASTLVQGTYKPKIATTEAYLTTDKSSEKNDDLLGLLEDVLIDTLFNETANNTSSNRQTAQFKAVVGEENQDNSTLVENPTGEKKPACKDKARNNPYDPHCEVVQSYYLIQHHWRNNNAWAILFTLKTSTILGDEWDEDPISHFVIRAQEIPADKEHSTDGSETRFTLLPGDYSKNTIAAELQKSGEYVFQVCAITASFQPGFLDDAQFSWATQAPEHRVHLHPTDKEQKEDAKKRGTISSESESESHSSENY